MCLQVGWGGTHVFRFDLIQNRLFKQGIPINGDINLKYNSQVQGYNCAQY